MKIEFTFEGKKQSLEAQNIRGQVWVHFQGRTFVYESEIQKRKSRKSAGGAAKGEVHAPMPGKVTKILRSVGASIKVGDAILVMEAMKMEYTLKSEIDGQLKSIDCQVGDQVALGKKLAVVAGANP